LWDQKGEESMLMQALCEGTIWALRSAPSTPYGDKKLHSRRGSYYLPLNLVNPAEGGEKTKAEGERVAETGSKSSKTKSQKEYVLTHGCPAVSQVCNNLAITSWQTQSAFKRKRARGFKSTTRRGPEKMLNVPGDVTEKVREARKT